MRSNHTAPLQDFETRCGLTVIEVLFAMVIILVGLVGIASIVPFAGRQAKDSYEMTQALALGESALGTLTQTVVQPRMDAPWQIVDDVYYPSDSSLSIAVSWSSVYREYLYNNRFNSLGLTAPYDSVPNRVILAQLQNQILGTGFCIDPLYWGYQERGSRINLGTRGNYRRTRFPFYNELMPSNLDPFTSVGPGSITTPRLLRVTQTDPLGPSSLGNGGWLRLASAQQLATISGGDLIPANPETDRSAAPLRGEYVDGNGALLQSPTNASAVSWMATLTPSDGTPLVTPDSLTYINSSLPPNIEFFPERYDLAVVVFGKRDVRELLDPSTGEIPVSERLGLASWQVDPSIPASTEHFTSGTFDIVISSPATDTRIRIGDWMMLSRYINAVNNFPVRERHKWYRVISVGNETTFPRQVRVAGQPWDWTQAEILAGSSGPVLPTTTVTMLKNVIQVYQRSFTPQPF